MNDTMKQVMALTQYVDQLLSDKVSNDVGTDLERVLEAYDNAIETCADYCRKKNPWNTRGKQRKTLVRDNMERMIKERETIMRAKQTYDAGGFHTGDVRRLNDFLDINNEILTPAQKGLALLEGEDKAFASLERVKDKEESTEMENAKNGFHELVDYIKTTKIPGVRETREAFITEFVSKCKEVENLCQAYIDKSVRKGQKNYEEIVRREKAEHYRMFVYNIRFEVKHVLEEITENELPAPELSYVLYLGHAGEERLQEEKRSYLRPYFFGCDIRKNK